MTDPAISRYMSELGKKGAKARAQKLTPAQRSEIARRGILTRIRQARPRHAANCRCAACRQAVAS